MKKIWKYIFMTYLGIRLLGAGYACFNWEKVVTKEKNIIVGYRERLGDYRRGALCEAEASRFIAKYFDREVIDRLMNQEGSIRIIQEHRIKEHRASGETIENKLG